MRRQSTKANDDRGPLVLSGEGPRDAMFSAPTMLLMAIGLTRAPEQTTGKWA
jgi:hypothetical protein